MAKGSGLSFDPDHTIIKSFFQPKTLFHNHHLKLKLEPEPSDSFMDSSTPPTIQFPVTLNCTSNDNQDDNTKGKRKIIDEMDFFSNKKDSKRAADDAEEDDGRLNLSRPNSGLHFNVNTGLRLLTTANTGSDESIVDDGISTNNEVKRAKTEMEILQAKLETMDSENRRLRDMLNQVTNNYNGLQMHMSTLMQQQQQQQQQQNDDHHNGGSSEEPKNAVMVPRQFMDLGLAVGPDNDGGSLAASDGRSNRVDSPPAPDKDFGQEDQSPESKVPRINHSPRSDEQAVEATMRKARVSVRARSEAPMITDGCQWRKYGQKLAKGNPCPRAYYRCTMAVSCPVRKQVQRCAEDRSILITTYEGNHNHPLPPAAMGMASTTSSAARMLLSGSMPSADGLINSNFLARTLLPCSSSMATISASAPFPTVTLDLTQSPNQLPKIPSNNFTIPFLNAPGGANPASLLPQIFGQALYNQSRFSGVQMSSQEMQHLSSSSSSSQFQSSQHSQLSETVNAIASDPNFTAVLAAAISSIIGGPGPCSNNVNTNGATSNNNSNGKQ